MTQVNVSSFTSKSNLANLKTETDKVLASLKPEVDKIDAAN